MDKNFDEYGIFEKSAREQLFDNHVQAFAHKKDSVIFEVLKKQLVVSDAVKFGQAFIIEHSLSARMHSVVTPAGETFFLDDEPLITFYPPKIETSQKDDGSVVVDFTQHYKDWSAK